MTSQQDKTSKKVTLFAVMEDDKETLAKIKENALSLLHNGLINETDVRSIPLFPSYRGSLVDAAEKISWEHKKWLRLVLKTKLDDVTYPSYQFEKRSTVPFYLLDAYEEAFEKAAKESSNPPKYIEKGVELGSILKVQYIDGETKRFSFLYKDKNSDNKFLSPVYSMNEHGEKMAHVVDWFLNENEAFKSHYNKILQRALQKQPSEIVDATNPNLVTVVNPAEVSVVCVDASSWPKLTHVTKINHKMLPRRSEYKYFLKQDIANPLAFSQLETPQARSIVGWKYTILGGTVNVPVLKHQKEKMKFNLVKSKKTFWRWVLLKTRKSRQK